MLSLIALSLTLFYEISGSENQFIKIWNTSGASLSTLRPSSGFLSQRVGKIHSLAFHPHAMLIAVGAGDSYISVSIIVKFWLLGNF